MQLKKRPRYDFFLDFGFIASLFSYLTHLLLFPQAAAETAKKDEEALKKVKEEEAKVNIVFRPAIFVSTFR